MEKSTNYKPINACMNQKSDAKIRGFCTDSKKFADF